MLSDISARWKILGALSFSDTALTVSQIARTMGQSRQSVQRLVDAMFEDGLLNLDENPEHKRAKLVSMAPRGESIFENMEAIQIPWANEKSANVDTECLELTLKTLRQLTANIQA